MNKQQKIYMVAEMIENAKNILREANNIAQEDGLYFSFEDIYEELSGNSSVDWNSSSMYC